MTAYSQNLLTGAMSNGYPHLPNNIQQNSITNNGQSTMGPVGVQRMIPTPGFSNQQNVPANPDFSNGTGYFNSDTAVAPHMQHQKQFPSNQNSHQIQHIRGLSNSGIHSNMLENSSVYGLSDGHMNGGMGIHGSNMQLTNRTTSSEAYMNISSYGSSPKPLQQQFNQNPPQRIPSKLVVFWHLYPHFYCLLTDLCPIGRNLEIMFANNTNQEVASL
jgi:E1A/CREB-binding protein